jgi:DNA-binding XRE family transcriptional regulator
MNKPFWAINLKKARIQMGMTQKDVADKIFKSQWTYGVYESGRCEPSIETWKLIWDLFKVTDPLKFWNGDYYEKVA